MLRKALFWAHLAVGCAVALLLLSMCLSGIGLAYRRQITNWMDARSRAAVQLGTVRLPVDELLHGVPEREKISAVTVASNPDEPVSVALGRDRVVYVDPYTGRVLGEGSRAVRHLFAGLERWHRALGEELQARGWRRAVVDAGALGLLGLLISGLVLAIPRKWSAAQVRSRVLFRRELRGRAAFWNLHHVAGIWLAIPLTLMAVTGTIMAYPWATQLLYRMTGSEPPRQGGTEGAARGGRGTKRPREKGESASLDLLFLRAKGQTSGWRTVTLRWDGLPSRAAFTIDAGDGGRPDLRTQLTLDGRSGEVRKWEQFSTYPKGRQLRLWARFLHTGEAGGAVGVTVIVLGATGGCVLAVTGLVMTGMRVRRRFARPGRQSGEERLAA